MGLMYIFPVEKPQDQIDDRIIDNGQEIILKTYGLPMIFWGYLVAVIALIVMFWVASKDVITKMLSYNDPGLIYLAILVKYTLLLTPVVLLGFFFYEKNIYKNKTTLKITHKIFFIPIMTKIFTLEKSDSFVVEHFLQSPNVAKTKNLDSLKHFENKGYFELKIINENNKKIVIDRHSRKADLLKLKELLSLY